MSHDAFINFKKRLVKVEDEIKKNVLNKYPNLFINNRFNHNEALGINLESKNADSVSGLFSIFYDDEDRKFKVGFLATIDQNQKRWFKRHQYNPDILIEKIETEYLKLIECFLDWIKQQTFDKHTWENINLEGKDSVDLGGSGW